MALGALCSRDPNPEESNVLRLPLPFKPVVTIGLSTCLLHFVCVEDTPISRKRTAGRFSLRTIPLAVNCTKRLALGIP